MSPSQIRYACTRPMASSHHIRRNQRPRGGRPLSVDLAAYRRTPTPKSIENSPIILRSKTTLVKMYAARLAPVYSNSAERVHVRAEGPGHAPDVHGEDAQEGKTAEHVQRFDTVA